MISGMTWHGNHEYTGGNEVSSMFRHRQCAESATSAAHLL